MQLTALTPKEGQRSGMKIQYYSNSLRHNEKILTATMFANILAYQATPSHMTRIERWSERHQSTAHSKHGADIAGPRISNVTGCCLLAGHLSKQRMYDSLIRVTYSANMVGDVYTAVISCITFPRMSTKFNHDKIIKLFASAASLKVMAKDILGPHPKTRAGKQDFFIITDTHSKLTTAIPRTKITSTEVPNIFFNYWIIPYRTSDMVLSDSAKLFFRKGFTYLCFSLYTTKQTTEAFRAYTNAPLKKTRHFSCGLTLYIAENKVNCDIFLWPLTYGYSCQVYHFTAKTPFMLAVLQQPEPTTIDSPTALPSYADNAASLFIVQQYIMAKLVTMQTKVSGALAQEQPSNDRYSEKSISSLPV